MGASDTKRSDSRREPAATVATVAKSNLRLFRRSGVLIPLALLSLIGAFAAVRIFRPNSSPAATASETTHLTLPATPPPTRKPPEELPPDPKVVAAAGDRTQINVMVGRLRDAAVRGDKITCEAMTQGLKRYGSAAREPLEKAVADEKDARAICAYHEAIERLKEAP